MLLSNIIAKPSSAHGLGLFATEPIPAGTVVWHPCTRCAVLPESSFSSLGESQFQQLDEYGYYLEDGSIILPCTLAFLLNHSCHANVLDYGLDFGIAVTDIAAGSEIFCDYRTFQSDPGWKVNCMCGFPDCAGEISPVNIVPQDLLEKWTGKIMNALKFMHHVPQPLHSSLLQCSRAYSAYSKSGFNLNAQQFSIRKSPVQCVEVTSC